MQKLNYEFVTSLKQFKFFKIEIKEDIYLIKVTSKESPTYILNKEEFNYFIEDYKKNILKKISNVYTFEDLTLFINSKKLIVDIKIYYKEDLSFIGSNKKYLFNFATYKIYLGDYILELKEEPKYKSPINFSYSQLIKKFNNECFNNYKKQIELINRCQIVNLNIKK